MIRSTHRRGSLFIDVLLAISVAALFAVALAGLAGMTNRSVSAARHETEATALAKASMEQVVAVKNADWNGLPLGQISIQRVGNTYQIHVPGADELLQQTFTRRVVISSVYRTAQNQYADTGLVPDANVLKVTVTVEWTEHGTHRQVSLVQYLTNWKRA